ncbi:MAG: S24 family peptidase [Pseudomonadota bacterium]
MIKSKIPPIEGSCSAKEVFALRALGDSMQPEFEHNVLLVIDPEAPVRDGSYVIAKVDGEFILRQLRIEEKRFFLQPLNDLYETVEISGVKDIVGLVIQQGSRKRNLKKYR